MIRITERELPYEMEKKYPFAMYAEYEDGYSCYVYDRNEDFCMTEIANVTGHGNCTYYTGVNNEDRTDGEWIGRENYIYK